MSEHLPVNCPKCGRPMRYVTSNAAMKNVARPVPPTVHVCECPEHGLFHFGPKIDLTEGPPPTW